MNSFFSTTALAATAISTLSMLPAAANADMIWTAHQYPEGRIRFAVGDDLAGITTQHWLDLEGINVDRGIRVTLWADKDSGLQHLGLTWVDADGNPQSDSLEQFGVVPENWTANHAKFSFRVQDIVASRGDAMSDKLVGRFDVSPLFDVQVQTELFSVIETDSDQGRLGEELSGDADGSRRVDVLDLLHVLSNFGNDCNGMNPCPGDATGNAVVNIDDILTVVQHLGDSEVKIDTGAKRLLFWQPVGGSFHSAENHVHPQIYNDEDGWQASVDHRIGPVVEELGPNTFDMFMWNVGGYWYDHDQTWPSGGTQSMIFEQVEKARQQRPGLVDYTPFAKFADANNIDLYGYIGVPRCWDPSDQPHGGFEPQVSHGDSTNIDRFYGELFEHGFKGIGHDAAVELPEDSPWLGDMAPELQRRGMEIFIEACPRRNCPWFLGMSVVAEQRMWERQLGNNPDTYFSEEEIVAAGGRAIHVITWPLGMSPNDDGYDADFDYNQWRYHIALQLLQEGKTVGVGLRGLQLEGYDIQALVDASRD